MAESDLIIVVLAAGKGTRLRSGLAKVLHRAGGHSLVEHVVRACQPLGAAEILVVVGHQAEDVSAVVAPLGARTVLQEPQLGTGHALQVARTAIGPRAKRALVVPGDSPLIRTETLRALLEAHRQSRAAASVLTAVLENPASYGRILRDAEGKLTAIVEEKAADATQRALREVNSSIYCFSLEKLWPCLDRLRPENVHRELYLTDAIAMLHDRGETLLAHPAAEPQEILGCNTRSELAEVDRAFRARKAAALMEAGVTIYLPETVLIDPEVEIGADTLIEPCVQLLGATRIGAGCTIRTGSVISDSFLEDGVLVRQHCLVTGSRLGPATLVGPFSHIRDGAELRADARVGNFVEVKKSVLHEGVKAMHLSYIGDASVGRSSNIGAGTITCNYDGMRKNRTTIGEQVFIGSGSELVAPIEIGDGAYVAAGSTVTESVPADALAIARERQAVKLGWAAERRAKIAAAKSASAAAAPARHSSANPPSPARTDGSRGEHKPRRKAPRARAKAKPAHRR